MSHSQHRLRPRIRARMRRPTPDPDPCQVVVTVLGWRSSRYLLACVAPVPCARRRCALMYAHARTPTPARPRPHAHACDQPFATLFAELFPFATQNARSIAQAVRLRRLTYVCDVPLGKRFAARPFGSQLGKCFGNRFARLFASIVCLELIGYCLWLWLNQSGVFAVCLTPSISLPYILPTFFAVYRGAIAG